MADSRLDRHEQVEQDVDPEYALKCSLMGVVAAPEPTMLEDGSARLPNGHVFDPMEFVPGQLGGLLYRCQYGRWDGDPGEELQCDRPAKRGMQVCARHGGTAVAKAKLNAMVVPVVDELIHIALDRSGDAKDRLRAIDSILDRVGGMPRQAEISQPEQRSALLERLAAVEVEQLHRAELEASEDPVEGELAD